VLWVGVEVRRRGKMRGVGIKRRTMHAPDEQARLDLEEEGGEKGDDHDEARERGDAEGLEVCVCVFVCLFVLGKGTGVRGH
jgi:hypothetical protein